MEDTSWADFKNTLNQRDNSLQDLENEWWKHSIYKVPACIRALKKEAYTPRVISFGPYHHGKVHLKQMEDYKHRAVLRCIDRSNKPIERYVEALQEVVQELMDYYHCLYQKWRNINRFLKLMILDGCFMLEFLLKDDPIFDSHREMHHVVPFIMTDMLMIENQLPMLLLKTLLAVERGNKSNDSLRQQDEEFLHKLICNCYEMHDFNNNPIKKRDCLHLLDVYKNSILHRDYKFVESPHNFMIDKVFLSATKLHEDGVQIQKSQTMNFSYFLLRGEILELPFISFDDQTELVILNVIAFELLHRTTVAEVTSYFWFMSCIVNSAEDVSILQSKGIIFSRAIGSDGIVKLIKELSTNVIIDKRSSAFKTVMEMQNHSKKRFKFRLNKWRFNFINTYFSCQWTLMISFLFDTLLMFLTITQTLYAIKAYYKPNSS